VTRVTVAAPADRHRVGVTREARPGGGTLYVVDCRAWRTEALVLPPAMRELREAEVVAWVLLAHAGLCELGAPTSAAIGFEPQVPRAGLPEWLVPRAGL
jgi:hypothetical protein